MSNLHRVSRQRSRHAAHPAQLQSNPSPSNHSTPLPPLSPTSSSCKPHLSPIDAKDSTSTPNTLLSASCSVSRPLPRVRVTSERDPVISRPRPDAVGPYPTFLPIRHNSLPSNCLMETRRLERGSRNCGITASSMQPEPSTL